MEEYRVIKVENTIPDPANEGYPFPTYDGSDLITITRHLVQVRSFILKILPAARLLHHLKGLKE